MTQELLASKHLLDILYIVLLNSYVYNDYYERNQDNNGINDL